MKKRHIALAFFAILGAADFAYGIWQKDQFSLVMGIVIAAVAASIAYREWKGAGS